MIWWPIFFQKSKILPRPVPCLPQASCGAGIVFLFCVISSTCQFFLNSDWSDLLAKYEENRHRVCYNIGCSIVPALLFIVECNNILLHGCPDCSSSLSCWYDCYGCHTEKWIRKPLQVSDFINCTPQNKGQSKDNGHPEIGVFNGFAKTFLDRDRVIKNELETNSVYGWENLRRLQDCYITQISRSYFWFVPLPRFNISGSTPDFSDSWVNSWKLVIPPMISAQYFTILLLLQSQKSCMCWHLWSNFNSIPLLTDKHNNIQDITFHESFVFICRKYLEKDIDISKEKVIIEL